MEEEKAKEFLWKFLDSGNYLAINKTLIKSLGITPAILLSDLISKEKYFQNRSMLADGWFFNTQEDIKDSSGLTFYSQQKSIIVLTQLGMIDTVRKGIPAKQYFKLNHAAVYNKLFEFKEQVIKIQRTINNNKYNNNIYSNKYLSGSLDEPLNNDILESDEIIVPTKHIRENNLIKYWNSLPNTHKYRNITSKIYVKISKQILRLKRGQLNLNSWDEEWFKSNKLVTQDLLHKYTDEEIKEGFKRLSQMLTAGYWPEDKSWVNKLSLLDLIYNPRQQNSWFLSVLKNSPKLLKQVIEDSIQYEYPDLISKFKEYFKTDSLINIRRAILNLTKFHNSLPEKLKDVDYDFGSSCSNSQKFCYHFLNWLKEQEWILNPAIGLCNIQGNVFRKYLDANWRKESNCLNKFLSDFLSKS